MTQEKLIDGMCAAMNALTSEWDRCDDETGEECKGADCHIGAHRAVAILDDLKNEWTLDNKKRGKSK